MNNTTIEKSNPKSGSIAVYQRLLPGRRPAKVEVLRAVYETYRNPDGRAFGRTNNTVLLRVSSGMDGLSVADTATLGQCGLGEREIAHVNRRLSELAGPARARTHELDILEAKAKLKAVVSLSGSAPSLATDLRAILAGALHEIGGSLEVKVGSIEDERLVPTESLTDTLVSLNRSCKEALALYKSLPKGVLPDDLVLEFQRSWFSYTDMVSTFRNRKCFSRPPGWSGLRAQIQTGHVYKHGAPIGDENPPMNSDAD